MPAPMTTASSTVALPAPCAIVSLPGFCSSPSAAQAAPTTIVRQTVANKRAPATCRGLNKTGFALNEGACDADTARGNAAHLG
jgi:hypothetical protein